MAGPSCIRTPLAQRWHRFRRRVLPAACFGAGVLLTLFLWERQAKLDSQPRASAASRAEDASHAESLLVSRSPVPPTAGANPPPPAPDPAQPAHAATGRPR